MNDEIMTDGGGRISLALALQVVARLGLDHMPSAYQCRFGSAKGLWSIDPQDTSEQEWSRYSSAFAFPFPPVFSAGKLGCGPPVYLSWN